MDELEMMQHLRQISSDMASLSQGVADVGKQSLDIWDAVKALLLAFAELDPRFGAAFQKYLLVVRPCSQSQSDSEESARVLAVLLRGLKPTGGKIQ